MLPALATERMHDDSSTTRAAADAEMGDAPEASPPPPRSSEQRPPSGGALNPAASEFVPVQRAAETEHESGAATDGTPQSVLSKRTKRKEAQLAMELRRARKATRQATEAAEAAEADRHNAEALLRLQISRVARPPIQRLRSRRQPPPATG